MKNPSNYRKTKWVICIILSTCRLQTRRYDAHYEAIMQYSFKTHVKVIREKNGKRRNMLRYIQLEAAQAQRLPGFAENEITSKFHLNRQAH